MASDELEPHLDIGTVTIWLVTDGCYSDYRVLGAFSTKEFATEAAKRMGASNDPEECSLDAMPDLSESGYRWRIQFDGDGNVVYHTHISCETACPREAYYDSDVDRGLHVMAFGKTIEDAIKSAADTRRMVLAMNPPPAPWHAVRFSPSGEVE